MSREVERVALLALVYRELSAWCSVGPRSGPDDLFTDIESGDEGLNLVRRIGSTAARDLDWAIVRSLNDPAELPEFAGALARLDPLRFEALLHAWPSGVSMPSSRLTQLERWTAVEEAIDRFRDLGLTATKRRRAQHVRQLRCRAQRARARERLERALRLRRGKVGGLGVTLAAGEEMETCPVCGEAVEADVIDAHLAGLDESRPECPHTDIAAIASDESGELRTRLPGRATGETKGELR